MYDLEWPLNEIQGFFADLREITLAPKRGHVNCH